MEKQKTGKKFAQTLRQIPVQKLKMVGLFLLAGFILTCGKSFFGSWPFGLAAIAASGGVIQAASLCVGSLLGSVQEGAILLLPTALLFMARSLVSMWLISEKGVFLGREFAGLWEKGKSTGFHRQRREKTAAGLRYSRASRRKRKGGHSTGSRDGADISMDTGQRILRLGAQSGNGVSVSALIGWADRYLLRENVTIRMAFGATAAFLQGAWAVVSGGYVYYDLLGTLFSVMATPLLVYLFYAALDGHMRTSPFREAGILTALAVLTYSLSGMEIPILGLNLGQMWAFAAAVLTGGSYGVARGTLVGLACGLFLEPLYTLSYALAGLAAGTISDVTGGSPFAFFGNSGGRPLGLLIGGAVGMAWAIGSSGYAGIRNLLPELLMTCAVLLPLLSAGKLQLPAHWCGLLPDTRRSEKAAVAEMVLAGREKKLYQLGEGMQQLGEMLEGVSEKLVRPGQGELRRMSEECFSLYCEKCMQRNRCREQEYAAWSRMVDGMAAALHEDGAVCALQVPSVFAGRCAVMGRILDEINVTAARRIGERRSGDRLRVTAEDFTHMGRLLRESARLEEEAGTEDTELQNKLEHLLDCHDFSAGRVAVYGGRHKRIFVHDVDLTGTRLGGEEISRLFGEAAGVPLSIPTFSLDGTLLSMEMHTLDSYHCVWGKAAKPASILQQESGNTPSGDTVVRFGTDGKEYMLLSDGMGTGRLAALTSGVAAAFLERMLVAGAGLEVSLRMLNGVIRSAVDECAATIDLCEIDLVTGEAKFIKSGAAPSFVIREGSLFRLQSKTVPIGILRALDAEMIRFTVQAGDIIVMLSDGIVRSYEDCPWLLDLLSADPVITDGNVQAAAEKIVEEAASRGAVDDITVGVMRVLV